MGTLLQDLKYGLRQLRRNPGFTAVAVLTLGLGIGATTSVFTAANDFLLSPLPFRNSDRLVFLKGYSSKEAEAWGIDPPGYKYLRDQNHVFEGMAALSEISNDRDFNLTGEEGPERVPAMKVTAEFFSVLGVKPVLGRTFSTAEDRPGANRVAMISHALWQTRYGGNPGMLGKSMILDGKGYTIIGVLPASFRFSTTSEAVWVPLAASLDAGYGGCYLSAVARLRRGVTLAQAQAEMDTLAGQFALQFPQWERDRKVATESLRARYVGELRPALLALLAAAGLVLLTACANLANLLLARVARRYKEIAVRRAVGASRARIVRQMLVESSLLAILGGSFGLLMAFADHRILYAVLPADWHPLTPGGIDVSVLLFTLVTSLFAVFLFGMAPAWSASGLNLNESLKEGVRTPRAIRGRLRVGAVAGEVALAALLAAGTGLLVRSFVRLSAANVGFQSENVLTIDLARTRRGVDAFYGEAIDRIVALPKVRAAGAINIMPLFGRAWGQDITIEGRPPRPRGDHIWSAHRSVTAGYFRAMGIPLLMGRSFMASDQDERVAVISDTMARRYWPGENPVGKRFGVNCSEGGCSWKRVIGVVGDVKEKGATAEPTTAMYFPETFNNMTLVVRAIQNPATLIADIRDIIHSIDPNQPVGSIRTMENVVSDSFAPRRLTMLISVLFATLAMLLAMVGVYGVVSYSVAQRTHEFGIRMALGAEKRDVLRMVVGQGIKLALIGVVIGIAGALALTRFLASLLYGVKPTDPFTFIAVSLILIAVALLACYIPARRASKVDPMVALRYE